MFRFLIKGKSIPPFSFSSVYTSLSFILRLSGYGSVIQMYPGGGPTRAGMESFGFPSHFHETLHEFPICKVNALLAGTLDLSEKDADPRVDGSRDGQVDSSQETSGAFEEGNTEPQSMEVSIDPEEEMKRAEREKLRQQRVGVSSAYVLHVLLF